MGTAMNWLQRISQSKAMPLPYGIPDADISRGFSRIDSQMSHETSDRQREQYPDISYLGSGGEGVASDIPDGALKYTDQAEEYLSALNQYKQQLPCLVRILEEPKRIQEDPLLWAIAMEKVQPLDEDERSVMSFILEWEIDPGRFPTFEETLNFVDLLYKKHGYKKPKKVAPEKIQRVHYAYMHMKKCFEDNEFESNDAHSKNVGWNKDGRMVLFDLGRSSFS
jgi:hypothetical protein